MIELIGGGLLGLFLASHWGLDVQSGWTLAALGAIGFYMTSCWIKPCRPCPWPWHRSKVSDKRGNYRRTTCWVCGGQDWQRLGARLIGRGGE